jgi:hypothetical protein
MPIIQVPFPSVDVVYDETRSTYYNRMGFFTMSDLCPTIRLDVVFTPGEYDVYEELCVGVILASAETYGSLANFGVTVSLNKIWIC